MNTRVGIVTVTYNSAAVLKPFLTSVGAQLGISVTLYAVDNDSSDGSVDLIESWDSGDVARVVIRSGTNLGVAEGNNLGIRQALADGVDWVLLLNNDTEFGPTMIADLVEAAVSTGASIVTPMIEGDDPPGSLWFGTGVLHPWQGYRATHVGAGAPFPAISEDSPVTRPTAYAPTCALLVAPDVFAAVGLMDPSYFVYFDDVDFCIRARRAGWAYQVASHVRLLHKAGSVTGKDRGAFTARWGIRNWVLVARRHATSPVQRVVSLLYIQAHLLAGSVRSRDPFWRIRLRERAYLEGLRTPRESRDIPGASTGEVVSRPGPIR